MQFVIILHVLLLIWQLDPAHCFLLLRRFSCLDQRAWPVSCSGRGEFVDARTSRRPRRAATVQGCRLHLLRTQRVVQSSDN